MDAFVIRAHHPRNRRATYINVADADLDGGRLRERVCEHRREGRFSDAALAREDQELVGDGGHARADERQVGVWSFWRRRADALVRTSRAGIHFPCLLAVRTRAVFCGGLLARAAVEGEEVPGSGAASCGAAFGGRERSGCAGG